MDTYHSFENLASFLGINTLLVALSRLLGQISIAISFGKKCLLFFMFAITTLETSTLVLAECPNIALLYSALAQQYAS